MMAFSEIQSLFYALGLTVFHSLWQITAIFAAYKITTAIFPRQGLTRYRLLLSAMLACLVWSALTFRTVIREIQFKADNRALVQSATALEQPTLASEPVMPAYSVRAKPEGITDRYISFVRQSAALLPWLGILWLSGALLFSIRLMGGYWLTRRLRRNNTRKAPATLQQRCSDWAKRLGIRHRVVQIFESPHIAEPLTIGFWKPLILFPAGLHLHLSPAQLEALLIHELAHIRRFDYLANLLQLLLETLFFYHPLFRLLSRSARQQREFCCDDIVLHHTTDPLLYARTLVELNLSLSQSNHTFAMAATGISPFSARILRLAGVQPQRAAYYNWLLIPVIGLCCLIFYPRPGAAASNEPEHSSGINFTLTLPETNPDSLPPGAKKQLATAKPAVVNASVEKNARPTNSPVAFQLDKMNVLYIGVDNPVHIVVNHLSDEQWYVRLKGDGAISGSNGNFVVQVTRPGEVFIEIYEKSKGGDKLIDSKVYRVKRIPDPLFRFAGMTSGSLSREKFFSEKMSLSTYLPNFDFNVQFELVNYTVNFVQEKGQLVVLGDFNTPDLPESAQQTLKNIPPGDFYLSIYNIRIKCPGESEARDLGGMVLKIKDN